MPYNPPIPDSNPPDKTHGIVSAIVQAETIIQVVFILPSAVCIGGLAGWWLDKHLHQSWMLVAGIVFGGISGLVGVVRLALATDKKVGRSTDSGGGTGNGS